MLQNDVCYCRETKPSESDKERDDQCDEQCPGNTEEKCGGHIDQWLITVSKKGENTGMCTFYMV